MAYITVEVLTDFANKFAVKNRYFCKKNRNTDDPSCQRRRQRHGKWTYG